MGVAGECRPGSRRPLQDRVVVYCGDKLSAGGVFDGHGGYAGALAAQSAADCFEKYITANQDELCLWSSEEWRMELNSLFHSMSCAIFDSFLNDTTIQASLPLNGSLYTENGIIRKPNGRPLYGGTTATITVVLHKSPCLVITANTGDSAAVLSPPDSQSVALTTIHSPSNRDEFFRIQSLPLTTYPVKLELVYDLMQDGDPRRYLPIYDGSGSKREPFHSNPWKHGLKPISVRYEPAVYAITPPLITRDTTCIAMTRSLGDFYAQPFGLTWEPSITIKTVETMGAPLIILATDGVWNSWHVDDLTQWIRHRAELSLSEVVSRALHETKWKATRQFGPRSVDDASLVIFSLERNS